MPAQDNLVLEGTWEQVSRRSTDLLAGRRVRIQLLPPEPQMPDFRAVPFHETATPEEWVEAFFAWGSSHAPRSSPPLSDEAVSRESIYGERLDKQR